ncbi:hypothetical protein [Sneathiella sp.]|uniref:hypothetical protein n=1 Tax=Sneathiella sp. TaxID=1964365 RepID=UPI003567DD37
MGKFFYVRMAGVFIVLQMASGCAVDRSTIPVDLANNISNPAKGVNIKIVSVEDTRVFEFKPRTPSIPSLSETEIVSPEIQARAVARKRNGYGQAFGDVVLPEGETVAGVMTRALTNAFRSDGYRVLNANDPDYSEAYPVTVQIVQFWSWIEWGFWQLPLHNTSEIVLKSSVRSLEKKVAVNNEVIENHTAIFESDWQQNVMRGMEELSTKAVQEFRKSVQQPMDVNKQDLKVQASSSASS